MSNPFAQPGGGPLPPSPRPNRWRRVHRADDPVEEPDTQPQRRRRPGIAPDQRQNASRPLPPPVAAPFRQPTPFPSAPRYPLSAPRYPPSAPPFPQSAAPLPGEGAVGAGWPAVLIATLGPVLFVGCGLVRWSGTPGVGRRSGFVVLLGAAGDPGLAGVLAAVGLMASALAILLVCGAVALRLLAPRRPGLVPGMLVMASVLALVAALGVVIAMLAEGTALSRAWPVWGWAAAWLPILIGALRCRN